MGNTIVTFTDKLSRKDISKDKGTSTGFDSLKKRKRHDTDESAISSSSSSMTYPEMKKTKTNNGDTSEMDDCNKIDKASFDSLSDDNLSDILRFVGTNSYTVFGLLNKRCNKIFSEYNIPKETFLYAYASLDKIIQHYIQNLQEDCFKSSGSNSQLNKNSTHQTITRIMYTIFSYNRYDLLDWVIRFDTNLIVNICKSACKCKRIDILSKVFRECDVTMLKTLKDIKSDLCTVAAKYDNLETLEWLRSNNCDWDETTFDVAVFYGHDHIADYLFLNNCPIVIEYCESDYDD